jgi:hypothetical protein
VRVCTSAGSEHLECRILALWKAGISSATSGRWARTCRHCGGGCSAFSGRILPICTSRRSSSRYGTVCGFVESRAGEPHRLRHGESGCDTDLCTTWASPASCGHGEGKGCATTQGRLAQRGGGQSARCRQTSHVDWRLGALSALIPHRGRLVWCCQSFPKEVLRAERVGRGCGWAASKRRNVRGSIRSNRQFRHSNSSRFESFGTKAPARYRWPFNTTPKSLPGPRGYRPTNCGGPPERGSSPLEIASQNELKTPRAVRP